MISIAVGEIPGQKIIFTGDNAKRTHPFQKKFAKAIEEGEALNLLATISGRATLVSATGSEQYMTVELVWLENPTVEIETWNAARSMAQHTTLRGIERFVAWAMLGRKPTDRECEFVHEAVLEEAAPEILNPVTGTMMPKRSSMMSVVEISACIEHAMVMLGLQDISDKVMAEIGGDMKRLWDAWYTWRYEQEEDPLFEAEQNMSWDEYSGRHPICEICGIGPRDGDPLERQHIVSGGSAPADYEKPWNWIHGHHSHHRYQHDEGWSMLLNQHPHMRGKVERARDLGRKKGLC